MREGRRRDKSTRGAITCPTLEKRSDVSAERWVFGSSASRGFFRNDARLPLAASDTPHALPSPPDG